ncbi:MAG: oligoendopeptidase F [Alphaproteobacteria bacterium]|nr:oligoendopeptidase F [Alphaproteobacteria bacterium]
MWFLSFMRTAIAICLAALLVYAPATAAPSGASEGMWDLTDLYPTAAAWEAEKVSVSKDIAGVSRFKGTLGRDAASLRKAFDAISLLNKRIARLAVYASLKADEDVRISVNQARNTSADNLYAQFTEATAWVRPEVLSVGAQKIESFIAADPGLKPHAFGLRDMLRGAPHALGEEGEQLMAAAANPLGQPQNVYTILANGEMPFPSVTLSDGKTVKLSDSVYSLYRQSRNRDDRKKVFDAFWSTYKTYEGTFGANLQAQLMGQAFNAKSRHYKSDLDAELFADNMPEGVVRTLISEVNRELPTFQRYLKLRARMLGLKDQAYYDVYAPLTSVSNTYSVDDAKRITLAALAPLGEEYLGILRQGFAAHWMNVYPHDGKRSGAYMNGGAYDVHPYLLLNHNNDYYSLSTFAHEWGHAVHTMLTKKNQPFELSNYATFVAETASIGNEVLLQNYVISHAKTKEEKLAFDNEVLDGIRTTYFRQTLFTEFLITAHSMVEKGEPVTGEKLTAMYCDLLKRYYGDAKGVMKIDPKYCIEWAFIPHFYRGFYVYNYATSQAGATYLADDITRNGAAAQKRFIDLLSAGASDYPYNLFKKAGIDFATPAVHRALEARMNKIMDDMEQLLAEK